MKKKPSKPQPKELIWQVQRFVMLGVVDEYPKWRPWHDCKSPEHAKRLLANIPGLVRVLHEGVDVTDQLVTEIKNENG